MILDGIAIARDLELHPGTLRNWASAGKLTRRGKDNRGRTLYDYDDVRHLARTAGIYDDGSIDLGLDVWIHYYSYANHPDLGRSGLITEHRRPDNGEWCKSSIYFDHVPVELRGKRADGTPHHVWHVDQADPLTLSPSLLCTQCQHHGFIHAGRWVPA